MNPTHRTAAAAGDPVHVHFCKHRLRIRVRVEIFKIGLTTPRQTFKLEIVIVISETNAGFEQFGPLLIEDIDDLLRVLDRSAQFRRRRAERDKIALQRLHPVDQRSALPGNRRNVLMGGAAEERMFVKLLLDHLRRKRHRGNLHCLVTDLADPVKRTVEIALGLAVLPQIEQRHGNLGIGHLHFSAPSAVI